MEWPPVGVDWYYADEAVTIYHGDCREILPTLSGADAVVTDPPYGIREAAGRKNKSRGKAAFGRGFTEPTDWAVSDWDNEPVNDALRDLVLAAAPHVIWFGGNYYAFPPSSCWIVWNKMNGGSDFADCELAWTNLPGAVRMISYRWNGMLQQHGGHLKETRVHPTQKPVEVMRFCIDLLPESDRLIRDPFMGSGTTLRAAKDLGRRAIGIEIEERYCEIAARRMAQEVLTFDRAMPDGESEGSGQRQKPSHVNDPSPYS